MALAATLPALAAGADPDRQDEASYSLSTGYNTSSGTYGTGKTTRISSAPVQFGFDDDDWNLGLRVPYLQVSGGTGVVPGVGATQNTNPNGRGRKGAGSTAQGLGDVVASATWSGLYSESARAGVDLTGKVKFGTAAANKGLGTGRNDYSAALGFFQSYDRATLMLDLEYTSLGSSSYLRLNSGVTSGSFGAAFHATDSTSLQLLANASGAVSPTSGRSRDLTASVSHRLGAAWRCSLYVLKGSGTGGPATGAGANLLLTLP